MKRLLFLLLVVARLSAGEVVLDRTASYVYGGWDSINENIRVEITNVAEVAGVYRLTVQFTLSISSVSGSGRIEQYTNVGALDDYQSGGGTKTFTRTVDVPPGGSATWRTAMFTSHGVLSDYYSSTWSTPVAFREVTLVISNGTGNPKSAGIFVQEYPGVAFEQNVVSANSVRTFKLGVPATDPLNVAVAFIDQAASKAAYPEGTIFANYERVDGSRGYQILNVVPEGAPLSYVSSNTGALVTKLTLLGKGSTGIASTPASPTSPPTAVTGGSGSATDATVAAGANSVASEVSKGTAANVRGLQGVRDEVATQGDRIVDAIKTGSGTSGGSGPSTDLPSDTDPRITGIGSSAAGRVGGYTTDVQAAQPSYTKRTIANTTAPSVAAGAWVVTFPGVGTLDLDPMTVPGAPDAAAACRGIASWFIVLSMVAWMCNKEWQIMQILSAQAGTTSGPALSILGNTSSIPSAMIKAGILVVVSFAAIPVTYALASNSLAGVDLGAWVSFDPIQTVAAHPTWGKWVGLADKFFPMTLAVASMSASLFFQFAAQAATFAASSAMRFAAA